MTTQNTARLRGSPCHHHPPVSPGQRQDEQQDWKCHLISIALLNVEMQPSPGWDTTGQPSDSAFFHHPIRQEKAGEKGWLIKTSDECREVECNQTN